MVNVGFEGQLYWWCFETWPQKLIHALSPGWLYTRHHHVGKFNQHHVQEHDEWTICVAIIVELPLPRMQEAPMGTHCIGANNGQILLCGENSIQRCNWSAHVTPLLRKPLLKFLHFTQKQPDGHVAGGSDFLGRGQRKEQEVKIRHMGLCRARLKQMRPFRGLLTIL